MAMCRAAMCAATILAVASGGVAHATEVVGADEYNKRLKIWQMIAPGGDTPFGEQINLYTGELSFRQTDIRFPGIGPDIAITRSTGTSLDERSGDPLAFGDWDIALPRIETLVALQP